MAIEIKKLVAAISPDTYCDPSVRKQVKEIAKKEGYLKAAEKANMIDTGNTVYDHDTATKDPLANWGLKFPYQIHEILYDSVSEGVEPVYFWILDFMERIGLQKITKVVDNINSSPGSGHFSEMGQKQTRMQEEAMKMLGSVNTVIKSILNIIYDLKEFKIRLSTYDDVNSKDKLKKNAAMLGLKQVWMDSVDFVKRGNTSLKGLAQQFDYVTIIDAFMAANSLEDVKRLDLNDRVKRILEQRIGEFLKWIVESEKELRKRYSIEKSYLRSQVASVKLYARWIKPYLISARKLENTATATAGLVTAFNTLLLELTLFGQSQYKPDGDVDEGKLPEVFKTATDRKYYSIIFVDFKFRGVPQRISQRGDWSFGGRTDVAFTAYGLNDEEVEALLKTIEEDQFGDVLKLIEGATTETLDQIKKDIDEFLEEDSPEKKKDTKSDDVNPFSSLFSFLKPEKKEKPKDKDIKPGEIKPDSYYEKTIRSQAILSAKDKSYGIFDIYKRAHRMPSFENPFG